MEEETKEKMKNHGVNTASGIFATSPCVLHSFWCFVFCFFIFSLKSCNGQGYYSTTSGTLLGKLLFIAEENTHIDMLLGVPYALPPIGHNRFRPPKAYTPPPLKYAHLDSSAHLRKVVRNATQFGHSCIQFGKFTYYQSTFNQMMHNDTSEDCLYLNVYIPFRKRRDANSNNDSALPKPIMMFIYGGGYVSGSGMFYDSKLLAARGDVIVVTFNYRLGPLGFLATLDDHAPGNIGLLDQNMALQWVLQNARNLGGDPDKILLFGESAGSAAVSAHIVSPMSVVDDRWLNGVVYKRPMFSKAILQSGVLLGMAAMPSSAEVLQQAVDFARAARCSSSSSGQMIDCLKKLSVQQLQRVNELQPTSLAFGPIVDGYFLPDDPRTILLNHQLQQSPHEQSATSAPSHISQIDMIVGWNSGEGSLVLFFGDYLFPNEAAKSATLSKQQFRQAIENFQKMVFSKTYPLVTSAILYEYARNEPERRNLDELNSVQSRPLERKSHLTSNVQAQASSLFSTTKSLGSRSKGTFEPKPAKTSAHYRRQRRSAAIGSSGRANYQNFMQLFAEMWMEAPSLEFIRLATAAGAR